MSSLMDFGTDPLLLTGEEIFRGVGQGAKLAGKYFTKQLPGSPNLSKLSFQNWFPTSTPTQSLDIEELRRVYHNAERILLPEESKYLHKQGHGLRENYITPENMQMFYGNDLLPPPAEIYFTPSGEARIRYEQIPIVSNPSGRAPGASILGENRPRPIVSPTPNRRIRTSQELDDAFSQWVSDNRINYENLPSDMVSRYEATLNNYGIQGADSSNVQQLLSKLSPEKAENLFTDMYQSLSNVFTPSEIHEMRRASSTPSSSMNPFAMNPRNQSGLTKDEVLAKVNIKDKDRISNLTEDQFKNTVLKPNGEVVEYIPGPDVNQMTYDLPNRRMVLKDQTPMSTEDYVKAFNEELDRLNEIINKNNKSGINYRIKELTPDGRLIFETPEQTINGVTVPKGESMWSVRINPGQWKGNVEDIANTEYFRSIPGLEMSNTSNSVFADRMARRGSGTYASLNEYLKTLDLGRVKPGFNSQTPYSKGAWENFINSGKGFGFYGGPNVVYGTMKTMAPYAIPTVAGAAALQKEKDGGWLDRYQDGGISRNRLKQRLLNKYPGMQSVYGTEGENLNIIKDKEFIPRDYGYGDIEFINPGTGLISYTDDYQYQSPTPDMYTVVYNPRGANRKDIALDMLHGMRDDKNYMKLLEAFAQAVKDARGNDMQYFYNEDLKKGFAEDGQDSWNENYIDGLLRAELAGYMARGRKDYKTERQAASPEMIARGKDIYNYVRGKRKKGGENTPSMGYFNYIGGYKGLLP
jgi:hypothetical protein